jgi:RNA polymerase sigma factor (sigma-70 family)
MCKNRNIEDIDIWHSFKNGSTLAFERIYSIYSTQLIKYGLKICDDVSLVEDCLHDLFVELWHSRLRVAEVQDVRSYLISAMRYKLFAAIKKSKNMQSVNLDTLQNDFTEPADVVLPDAIESNLKNVLEKLPTRQKEVIYLHFYLRCGLKEIADILQINYQSVANLIHRSIIAMRKNVHSSGFYYCFLFILFLEEQL